MQAPEHIETIGNNTIVKNEWHKYRASTVMEDITSPILLQ